MTSDRISSLTILTFCMFALVHYMQHGIWIFPFGLYKTALFVAILLMFIVERKRLELSGWLAIGWSFTLMLTSRFFLELFISDRNMKAFQQGLFIDFAFILFCLLFAIWGVLISLRTTRKWAKIGGIFCALALTGCFLLNAYIWAVFPLIGWLVCIFQDKDRSPVHFAIMTLLGFLYITTWISGAYWGTLRVLGNM